jgi:hypothetical protein
MQWSVTLLPQPREEGLCRRFLCGTAGMLLRQLTDQHDTRRRVCFTYLRAATLGLADCVRTPHP